LPNCCFILFLFIEGTSNSTKKGPDDHERIRRAAEREGRRTRRRRDREKTELDKSHLDGMSSDDEISDQDQKQLQIVVQQICAEAAAMFEDAADEYSQIPDILGKLENWKCQELDSYKDAYISLCVPKILGPLIRLKLIVWNPLEQCEDFEKMQWYSDTLGFSYNKRETEKSLANDLDVRLVPALVEKILLPKLTEIIENCWDPLSTTQTLKLVQLISRLGRDYPSLRVTSKSLRTLFTLILGKMKLALDNDVFIPIMQKQCVVRQQTQNGTHSTIFFSFQVDAGGAIILLPKTVLQRP
jgi:GC-rich sequence DNA-binding factor